MFISRAKGLMWSQKPATFPQPEPDEDNPNLTFYVLIIFGIDRFPDSSLQMRNFRILYTFPFFYYCHVSFFTLL